MFSLGKILESEDWHGKAAGSVLKMALTVDEGIQVELLISAERKRAPFLLQHGLVTVDGKGMGVMHDLTQDVVQEHLPDTWARRSSGEDNGGHAEEVSSCETDDALHQSTVRESHRGVGLLERLLMMCTRVAIFFRYVCGQYAQASDMLEMSLECAELWYGFAHAVVQQLRECLLQLALNQAQHEEAHQGAGDIYI